MKPKQLCLLAFLPHILDSKADGRQAYLQVRQQGRASGSGSAKFSGLHYFSGLSAVSAGNKPAFFSCVQHACR